MNRRALLGLLAALPLVACGPGDQPRFNHTDLSSEGIFPSGKLPGADGRPREFADFRGQAVFVYFGYTNCPDSCPGTLRKYASLVRNLRSRDAERVQVVFISIDPERDTPLRADTYAKWFNPRFIGLSGSPEEIAAMAGQFKATYARQAAEGGTGYAMEHSSNAYLIDPKGQLRLSIPESALLDPIARDLEILLGEK